MNERQRTAYLEAMGIQAFVPRWVLPAAAPSRQAPLPEPEPLAAADAVPSEELALDEAAVVQANGEPRKAPNQRVAGVVSGIMGELAGREPAPVEPKADPATSQAKRVLDVLAEPVPTETVHFSLCLWRVTDALMVIDSHQTKQALPTNVLLSNILFAKGLRASLPRPEVLNWPVPGVVEGEGGWTHAREMVQAFLNARFERQPVQAVWLMGEPAYRAVCSAEGNYQESTGQLRDLAALGCLAVILPSLTDMLRSPSLKAPAWQAIKAQKIG